MGFLDNLESSLKSLEAHGESVAGAARDRRRRETDRARIVAESQNAERLRTSPYTAELLRQLVRIGHGSRTKVRMAWLGATLRFEARERRLELRPTADGIVAVFLDEGEEKRRAPVNLEGNPEELARDWLG